MFNVYYSQVLSKTSTWEHTYLYERAALQFTRPFNTRLCVAGPLCGTMPQAGFNPPSAEVQSSTECEFDTFTLQATTAGL